MAEYFADKDGRRVPWRALQVWQILIGCAYNQQIVTYGDLAEMLEYQGAGTLGQILAPIMYYCEENDIPPLTSLVVNQQTGEPGSGFEFLKHYDTVDSARMEVFRTDWYALVPPTPDQFQDVWERNKPK